MFNAPIICNYIIFSFRTGAKLSSAICGLGAVPQQLQPDPNVSSSSQFNCSICQYNVSPAHRTYPFCPVGDYQSNGQTYYSTTAATGNYTTTSAGSTGNAHSTTLPYLVPVDDSLLLNGSSQSHSRDSPHSLTVSEVKMKMKLKNPKPKTIEPLSDTD